MKSTMQDVPAHHRLACCEHGTTVHADTEVVTATADGVRTPVVRRGGPSAPPSSPTASAGSASRRPAGRDLQWNNVEHLEAYLAVPSMGAVLHTLNIRLFPEQLVYIANHAEDRVVIVDDSLVALLAHSCCRRSRPCSHVLVAGPDAADADLDGARGPPARRSCLYEDLLAAAARGLRLARGGRARRRRDVLHQRHHRQPQGRRLQPPLGLPALDGGQHGQRDAASTPYDRMLPIVPMFHANAWGLAYAALMVGAALVHARPMAPGRAAGPDHPGRAGSPCRGPCPTIWNDILQYLDEHDPTCRSTR